MESKTEKENHIEEGEESESSSERPELYDKKKEMCGDASRRRTRQQAFSFDEHYR